MRRARASRAKKGPTFDASWRRSGDFFPANRPTLDEAARAEDGSSRVGAMQQCLKTRLSPEQRAPRAPGARPQRVARTTWDISRWPMGPVARNLSSAFHGRDGGMGAREWASAATSRSAPGGILGHLARPARRHRTPSRTLIANATKPGFSCPRSILEPGSTRELLGERPRRVRCNSSPSSERMDRGSRDHRSRRAKGPHGFWFHAQGDPAQSGSVRWAISSASFLQGTARSNEIEGEGRVRATKALNEPQKYEFGDPLSPRRRPARQNAITRAGGAGTPCAHARNFTRSRRTGSHTAARTVMMLDVCAVNGRCGGRFLAAKTVRGWRARLISAHPHTAFRARTPSGPGALGRRARGEVKPDGSPGSHMGNFEWGRTWQHRARARGEKAVVAQNRQEKQIIMITDGETGRHIEDGYFLLRLPGRRPGAPSPPPPARDDVARRCSAATNGPNIRTTRSAGGGNFYLAWTFRRSALRKMNRRARGFFQRRRRPSVNYVARRLSSRTRREQTPGGG